MSFEETESTVDNGVFASPNNRTKSWRVVGVDAGNRQVKLATTGLVKVVPSVIKQLHPLDSLPSAADTFSISYLTGDNPELRGKRWMVGKLAAEMAGRATFKGEKSGTMPELVMAALAALATSESMSIGQLRLCLPEIEEATVTTLHQQLKGLHQVESPLGASSILIKSIQIELEGESAYKWLMAAKFYQDPGRINGIIDIGGGNSTCQLFSSGGHLIRESRKVLPGMFSLAKKIASDPGLIGSENKGVSPKPEIILDAISDQSFAYGTTGIIFKSAFDSHFQSWLDDFRAELKTQWQDYLPQVAEVAIVGGGAPLMHPLVSASKNRFRIAPENTTATVRGMVM